jgi:DNA topoisomerase I
MAVADTLGRGSSTQVEPVASAREAGLLYVSEDKAGIRRVKAGPKNFRYFDGAGKPVQDKSTLARIRRLAIPPAWTEVWICPKENGHLQATGRDARGRKQYRYHSRWREVRDETKFNRMLEFAQALPRIRRAVRRHLKLPGLPREKVLATVVKLLETGLIRVGNDEYARTNKSYGLTTLQDRHAKINGSKVRFNFRGKSGKFHVMDIHDPHIAKIVRNCQAIPGQELFQFWDDSGQPRDITSTDVNDYLREISGQDFTAKDFRTWAATVLAAMALREFEKFDSKTRAKKNIRSAIESVAQKLGNTPSICRKCYIHPAILEAYLDGTVIETFRKRAEQQMSRALPKLQPEEAAVLALLQQRLAAASRESKKTLLDKLEASIKHRKKSSGRKGAKHH